MTFHPSSFASEPKHLLLGNKQRYDIYYLQCQSNVILEFIFHVRESYNHKLDSIAIRYIVSGIKNVKTQWFKWTKIILNRYLDEYIIETLNRGKL